MYSMSVCHITFLCLNGLRTALSNIGHQPGFGAKSLSAGALVKISGPRDVVTSANFFKQALAAVFWEREVEREALDFRLLQLSRRFNGQCVVDHVGTHPLAAA